MMKKILFLLLLSFNTFAGSLGLDWVYNETLRSDNVTPFDMAKELAGFKAKCNTDASNVYPITFDISDPLLRSFNSGAMPADTYNCVMTAIDTGNRESLISNIINITLDIPPPKSVTLTGQSLP